jgi:hypothetical protein
MISFPSFVMMALCFVNIAVHPSSHSLPIDINDWCSFGNTCAVAVSAETCGKCNCVTFVESMVDASGSVTLMLGLWLWEFVILAAVVRKWPVHPVSNMALLLWGQQLYVLT